MLESIRVARQLNRYAARKRRSSKTLSVLAALQVTDSCGAIALGVAYARTTIVQSEAVCSRCARTACLRCRRDGSILSRRARVYVGLWRPIIRCRLARQLSDPLR